MLGVVPAGQFRAVGVALGLLLLGAAGARADAVQTCKACSPPELIDEAERAMREAMTVQLKRGRVPEDRPALFLVAAHEHMQVGRDQEAIPFAQRAAAECVLSGDEGCAETIAVLAELTLSAGAGDVEEDQDLALAYLSLVPYERLDWRLCTEAVVLRYRLTERRSPRAADPLWADRCGPVGRTSEAGYRAAKAALLKGDVEGAKERLNVVRAFTETHAVRATYLRAVVAVAEDKLDEAAAAFENIAALPPARYRTEEEDDARILSHIQLARIERERGNHDSALEAYRSVPALSWQRSEALLEAAVTAAHVGNLGAARNYLAALERYEPEMGNLLEMYRVQANLSILDGSDEDAMVAFQKLSSIGRRVRAETFGDGAPPFEQQLAEDPTVGGLLDAREATRLVLLEEEVKTLQGVVAENDAAIALLQRQLADGGPQGPLFRALEKLREADVLLRRAQNLQSQRERRGIKVAAADVNALATFRRALRVREQLDAALADVMHRHQQKARRVRTILAELETDQEKAKRVLGDLGAETDLVVAERKKQLREKAEQVVHRLELSEETGLMELKLYRKNQMTQRIQAIQEEYAQGKATLYIDSQQE